MKLNDSFQDNELLEEEKENAFTPLAISQISQAYSGPGVKWNIRNVFNPIARAGRPFTLFPRVFFFFISANRMPNHDAVPDSLPQNKIIEKEFSSFKHVFSIGELPF